MTTGNRDHLAILQVSAEYPPDPGGVGDYTRMLGRALLERRHRVAVLTGESSTRSGPPLHEPGDPRPQVATRDWSWRSIRPLLRAIATHRPDIVHIQYQTGAYMMHPAINLLPWSMRRRAVRPRIAVTAHDLRMPYLFPKAGLLRRWVTRRLLQDADAVIVTNAADREALAGNAPYERDLFCGRLSLEPAVIPIGSNIARQPPVGFDRAAWRHDLGVADGEIIGVFFGLASPSKGLIEAIQALAGMPGFVRMLVVGGEARLPADREYAARVQALVDDLGVRTRIVFTGHCVPEAVSAHLLAADFGVLPFSDGASYRRGSLLACMAHEVPIITTHPQTPPSPALVDGEQALLVSPGAVEELRGAMLRLVLEPALRARLSASARALHAHFSWRSIAAAHEDVYNALVAVTR